MAFNDILSGFRVQSNEPIDSRLVCADLAARDAIPASARYEGLQTYVVSEQKIFILQGGIENTNYINITDAIQGEFLSEYETADQIMTKLDGRVITEHETADEIDTKVGDRYLAGTRTLVHSLTSLLLITMYGKLVKVSTIHSKMFLTVYGRYLVCLLLYTLL